MLKQKMILVMSLILLLSGAGYSISQDSVNKGENVQVKPTEEILTADESQPGPFIVKC